MTAAKLISRDEREAVYISECISDALLRLEIWEDKARMCLPYLIDIQRRLEEDGLEERDLFEHTVIKTIIAEIKRHHKIGEDNDRTAATPGGTDGN